MGHKLLLLVLTVAMFTSCSTYKAGQTPDDIYYSPAREVVAKQEKETKRDRYQEYISSEDDRYLRMKIQNRERWADIDDYSYWNDSRYHDCNSLYSFNNGYNNRFVNTYSDSYNKYSYNNTLYSSNTYRYNNCVSNNYNRTNYFGYGGYYSPRYPIVYYKSPKVYTGNTGKINLSTYRNPNYNNTNFGPKGSNQNFGSMMKRVFSDPGSSSNGGSSWERPVRTMESGSSTNSNAGGKSGGYNSTGISTETKRGPR